MGKFLTTLSLGLTLLGFSSVASAKDVHSYANSDEVVVEHLHLDIAIDFQQKKIKGSAALSLKHLRDTNKLVLDTKLLTIHGVSVDGHKNSDFTLGSDRPYMGRALEIPISPSTKVVTVYYESDPTATAVQWLTPEQTAGGKLPFMFTQSQAILARSWVPIQDSPGVRITYTAKVSVDPELLPLMSASNPVEKNSTGVYEFEMKQPIPAYLLALAAGDIAFKSLGKQSGVYAEPSILDKAHWEFADTEKMIDVAESIYGKYAWERYDILVLPPSFPFGGMENPRLTFATPTILAGDRSLVSLVAHELAHSWSGNLVTNATWDDFWLNEAFTTYFENRIMEKSFGKDYALMLSQLGYQDAVDEVDYIGAQNRDTHLKLDLKGRDPDDGMTDIAYEKGRLFLTLLENTVGRSRWDAFLNEYFNTYRFKSITTSDFVKHLKAHLLSEKELKSVNLDAWIYGPGLPSNVPTPKSAEFAKVEKQISDWLGGKDATALEVKGWTTHHWLHFLRNMPKTLSQGQLSELDKAFGLNDSGNSEIVTQWFLMAIANDYPKVYGPLDKFLKTVGRRKFLKPLYEALAKTPKGKAFAKEVYKTARSGYHPVSYQTIDAILK